MPDHADARDDFYVGYLALPRSHRRFLQIALPLTLLLMLASAAAIALSQRDPGPGVWQSGEASVWRGWISVDPYPILHATHDDSQETYLLVRMGKHAASDAGARWAEAPLVSVRGRLLERDGRRMIELDDAPGADPAILPVATDAPRPPSPAPTILGPVDIRGEILDAKCYLGAMKPGDGKAHKSCAILCLSGGIPPMLYSRDADGARRYHLLIEDDDTPLRPERHALAGEPVRVTGNAVRRSGLDYIRVTEIRRE